jgi:putative transposase
MEQERTRYPVNLMCRALDLSRSGYYAWRRRPESQRAVTNRRLTVEIKSIHEASLQTYGSPRMHFELRVKGFQCSLNRIARLMQQAGIRVVMHRRFCLTTDSNHDYPVAANILNRQFAVSEPNRVWVVDITYIATDEGWLYLAATMDLYSRRIVGWAFSDRIDRELTMKALSMALGRRQPGPELLHHSDRGSQYACHDYQDLLSSRDVICSMSRSGNPFDNAVIESFFRTLKVEMVYRSHFGTREVGKAELVKYIELFYNAQRRHSALGYLSPAEFERQSEPT